MAREELNGSYRGDGYVRTVKSVREKEVMELFK